VGDATMRTFSSQNRSESGAIRGERVILVWAWDSGPDRALGGNTSLGEGIITRIKVFSVLSSQISVSMKFSLLLDKNEDSRPFEPW